MPQQRRDRGGQDQDHDQQAAELRRQRRGVRRLGQPVRAAPVKARCGVYRDVTPCICRVSQGAVYPPSTKW